MIEDDRSYYLRRAAAQKALAERAGNAGIAKAHRTLADLLSKRAREFTREGRTTVLSLFTEDR